VEPRASDGYRRGIARVCSNSAALGTLLVLTIVATAWPDGGVVRLHETSGPLAITVFSAEPLRAGPADLSVLVQSVADGNPLLDATVEFVLVPPDGGEPLRVRATQAAATNKLMQAALVVLDRVGEWQMQVEISRGPVHANASGVLTVEAPLPRLLELWPYLALPPAAVALFALRLWLLRRRRM